MTIEPTDAPPAGDRLHNTLEFTDLEIGVARAYIGADAVEKIARPELVRARRAIEYLQRLDDPLSGAEAEFLHVVGLLEGVGDTIPSHKTLAQQAARTIKELLGGVRQYFRLVRMNHDYVDALRAEIEKMQPKLEFAPVDAPTPLKTHIEAFTSIVDMVEARCMAVDGPVTPTMEEISDPELAALWRAVQGIRVELAKKYVVIARTATKDQIASVMFQHGNGEQQVEALRYAHGLPVAAAPKAEDLPATYDPTIPREQE